MTIREKIVAKVQNLPENVLPEVFEFVKKVGEEKKSGLLRRLQKIKIEAPADFSRNVDLYLNGEKEIEPHVD